VQLILSGDCLATVQEPDNRYLPTKILAAVWFHKIHTATAMMRLACRGTRQVARQYAVHPRTRLADELAAAEITVLNLLKSHTLGLTGE